MISFKQFIQEPLLEKTLVSKAWEVKKLKTKAAIQYLNDHCKDGLAAIANGGVIYRSFIKPPGKTGKILMLDSTESKRTSRDSNNLYQLMFDVSKSMADVPSRSSSFICSTSIATVSAMGGSMYAIVPLDGTTIAVSSDDDIFETSIPIYFNWNNTTTVEFFGKRHSDFFQSFVPMTNGKFVDAEELNIAMSKFTPEEQLIIYDQFYESIRLATSNKNENREFYSMRAEISYTNLKKPDFAALLSKFAKEFIVTGKYALFNTKEGHKDLLKILRANPSKPFTGIANQIADKKKLKISTVKYGEKLPYNKECWFSGKCVAIPAPLWLDIIREMEKQNMPIYPSMVRLVAAAVSED